MIEQQGIVTAVGNGTTTVTLGPAQGCAICEKGQGCGAGIFARWLPQTPMSLPFTGYRGYRVGQVVRVGIPGVLVLRLAWLSYGMPLLAALAAAALTQYFLTAGSGGGLTDLLVLLAALAAGYFVLRLNSRRRGLAISTRSVVLLAADNRSSSKSNACYRKY